MRQAMQMPRGQAFGQSELDGRLALIVRTKLRVEEGEFRQVGAHVSIIHRLCFHSLFSHHFARELLCRRTQSPQPRGIIAQCLAVLHDVELSNFSLNPCID